MGKLTSRRFLILGILLVIAIISYKYSLSNEKIDIVETESKDKSIEVTIKIPKLKNIGNTNFVNKFNSLVQEKVKAFVEEVREAAKRDKEEGVQQMPYIAYVSTDIKYQDKNFLSMVIYYYQFTGGAHGSTSFDTYNINLKDGILIKLSDILSEEATNVIKKEILNQINAKKTDFFPESFEYVLQDDIFTRPFTIEATCLKFFYNHYEIAPYSSGIPEFCISWKMLEPYILSEEIKKQFFYKKVH